MSTVTVSVDLAPAAPSISTARRLVRDACVAHDPPVPAGIVDDLVLATSELVTNAIEHGDPTPVRVIVSVHADEVAVTVRSRGNHTRLPDPDVWRPAPSHRESGRGLGIVRRLTDRVDVAHVDGTIDITITRTV